LKDFDWLLELLGKRLLLVLEGKEVAKPGELLELARMSKNNERHASAVRLYHRAFQGQPGLAEDQARQHRYNAACSASLAAAGQGEESAKLDDKQRARWRRQAVAWLKADLAAWAKELASAKPQAGAIVPQTLSHWQKDADLAGIRDKEAVTKLPAEEQAACHSLWADVAALLKKAAGTP
jgi:hypothetical protein